MEEEYRRNSFKTWFEDLGILYIIVIALVLGLALVSLLTIDLN